MSALILETWSHNRDAQSNALVVPDGCRDIIFEESASGNVACFISPLVQSAYEVQIPAGVKMQGFRLQPGTTIDEDALFSCITAPAFQPFAQSDWVDTVCYLKPSVKEALLGLRMEYEDLGTLSKNLGVSGRTLQRHVKKETGQAPSFWVGLVRARRCAKMILRGEPLVEAAMSVGYSDQPHMTRELKRWFNCTPAMIRGKQNLPQLLHSGYD